MTDPPRVLDHGKRLRPRPCRWRASSIRHGWLRSRRREWSRADRPSFATPSPRHRRHIAARRRRCARTPAWSGDRCASHSARSTCEADAWSAIMRPNRSVEMPPTNPAGAPRRAMPTAMLRHEPPATGTTASRPSTDLTGRKSTRASPQLSSIALSSSYQTPAIDLDPAHRIAAVPVQFSHQSVNPSLGPVEVGHPGRRRLARAADRRHRGHGLADRSVSAAGDGTQHGGAEQDRFLRFGNRNRQAGRIRHDLADQRTSSRAAADHHQIAVDTVRCEKRRPHRQGRRRGRTVPATNSRSIEPMSTSRSIPATTARESGSAKGDRLPRNSGRTWMSRANNAASPGFFARETMRRSRNSRISMPAACAAATAS